MERGWRVKKKVSLRRFLADQKIVISWEKMRFGASYSTSNKLLLVARHILTTGLQKCLYWLAVYNSQIHCHHLPLWRKYEPEVKAAKGPKRCRAKVKGVNNPAWTAQEWITIQAVISVEPKAVERNRERMVQIHMEKTTTTVHTVIIFIWTEIKPYCICHHTTAIHPSGCDNTLPASFMRVII